MSTARYVTVLCDLGIVPGVLNGCEVESGWPCWTAREARRRASEHGWKHRDGKDICPKCAAVVNRAGASHV